MHVSIEGTEPRVFAAGGRWTERVLSIKTRCTRTSTTRATTAFANSRNSVTGHGSHPIRPISGSFAVRR